MELDDLVSYILDREFIPNKEWYLHATKNDIEVIKCILNEGITSGYLRSKNGNNFNGKYYVSLYKNIDEVKGIKLCCNDNHKFIVNGINPYYADREKDNLRKFFINTRIPLRTSEWDGEYQQYLKISSFNIVGIDYILSNNYDNLLERLRFLKEIILCLD